MATTGQRALHPDSAVIDRLGGTGATARLCEISSASVCDWRLYGIPKARRQFLKLARPEVFEGHQDVPLYRRARRDKAPQPQGGEQIAAA